MEKKMTAFFISYNSADRSWAEWIAWQLEEAGYSTVLDAWDFRPGSNFVLEMDSATKQAESTIAVLSPDYFASRFAQSEWAAAFARDPRETSCVLLPIRVRPCKVTGLLAQIVWLDLVGLDEETSRKRIIDHIRGVRLKPLQPPQFPGAFDSGISPPSFPGPKSALKDGQNRESYSADRTPVPKERGAVWKPLSMLFPNRRKGEGNTNTWAAKGIKSLAERIGEIYNDLQKRELMSSPETLAYCIDVLKTSQALAETIDLQDMMTYDVVLSEGLRSDLQEAKALLDQFSRPVDDSKANLLVERLHLKVLDIRSRTQS
jgi:hypothetical protein